MKPLRLGDQGQDVALLQRRLVRAGYGPQLTHVYDAATEAAVTALQIHTGLVVDGIAGPKTLSALACGERHRAHLSDADLQRAAHTLGVSMACIRAVNEVESRGAGFLPDGRPTILFERHVFWQRLKARQLDPAALTAKHPNIVAPVRGGYHGGAAEYTRLAIAAQIESVAAHESASWGAFQILGQHWARLGYASVDDFVDRMQANEAEQLDAFVRFVAADRRLLAALRGRRWVQFARLYNGPGYSRNLYDTKLAQAYRKYARATELAA
ncbi:N-acetylmuramidase family protein [Mycetohabitans endofungorum]|uniref:N-acetylmuramidase family protein n=1 Tax=Mycetohabitans endofungorum TaxID=417203 RepID=UPI002B05EABF|nr:N-acetylmuramidase family protein [Mycetohabitans endofungorum]